MNLDEYALSVTTGAGMVARSARSIAVAAGSSEVAGGIIAALLRVTESTSSVSEFANGLNSEPELSTPAAQFAIILVNGEGIDVFVRGAAQVRTAFSEVISGPDLTHSSFPEAVTLWIGVVDPPSSQAHPIVNLERGVVPGGGAVFYMPLDSPAAGSDSDSDETMPGTLDENVGDSSSSSPPPPPPADLLPPAPVVEAPGEPAVAAPFVAIDWQQEVATSRESLPVAGAVAAEVTLQREEDGDEVLGIHCSRGHFNNPLASYCQVCGISMVHLTHRLVPGIRPTLGFIVFGDGTTYALDRSYTIGRNPSKKDDATPLIVQDPFQSISREHALLELSNWDVVYTDLGSTNGSFCWNGEQSQWVPIAPGVAHVLASGDAISVGRSAFTFEGASRALSE